MPFLVASAVSSIWNPSHIHSELLPFFQVDSNLCEALLTTGEPDLAYHPKLFISMCCRYYIFMCLVHVC